MVNIITKGMDPFLAFEFDKKVSKKIAKLLKINDNDVNVIALESMIIHDGVDQSSMHLMVEVEFEKKYDKYEEEIFKIIKDVSKEFTIHLHVYFKYLEKEHCYENLDHQYPLYLDETNTVDVEETEVEDESINIYDGNAFEKYESVFDTKKDE